ncbi:MAG: ribonuclease HI [Bdellovibrionales bacterium]
MLDVNAYLYTDGACSGNPGPGGWGYVLFDLSKSRVFEGTGFDPKTTNNRMEMMAVIEGLHFATQQKIKTLLVLTDSTYVIRGFTQWRFGWKKRGWKTQEGADVQNQDLWQQLDAASVGLKLEWRYVRGHQGTPGNERVDQMAVASSKQTPLRLYQNVKVGDYLFDANQLPEGEPLPEMNWQKPAESKNAFYVSFVNGVLTRHSDWSSCERTVKGQSKALYKKVTSEQELQDILKKWGVHGS